MVLADDKTHACNVVLMDRIVKRIAATTATNVLNEMKKAYMSAETYSFIASHTLKYFHISYVLIKWFLCLSVAHVRDNI